MWHRAGPRSTTSNQRTTCGQQHRRGGIDNHRSGHLLGQNVGLRTFHTGLIDATMQFAAYRPPLRILASCVTEHSFVLVGPSERAAGGADYGGAPDYPMFLPHNNHRRPWPNDHPVTPRRASLRPRWHVLHTEPRAGSAGFALMRAISHAVSDTNIPMLRVPGWRYSPCIHGRPALCPIAGPQHHRRRGGGSPCRRDLLCW